MARKAAVKKRAATEEYARQTDTGEAPMLGEPEFAGWQEGTYSSKTTITSGGVPSAAYMTRGWDIATPHLERGAVRFSIYGMLCWFDPDGQVANTGGDDSDETTLLKRTRGQQVSAEILKTDIFDARTKVLLGQLTCADLWKVVDLLCPKKLP